MNSIITYFFLFICSILIFGCGQVYYSLPSEESAEDESLNHFDILTNDNRGNLRIITEGLSEDLVLCVDGEILGTVPENSDITTRIELSSDELKNLWLIPFSAMNDTDEAIFDKTRHSWIAKLYVNDIVRVWTPGQGNTSDSGSITFYPPSACAGKWDYVIGYLNGDETTTPIAVLSPYDSAKGVSTTIDYGRLSIIWKYYANSIGHGAPALVYEGTDDFVFTIDDADKSREIPVMEYIGEHYFRLTVINNEDSIVSLYLNGTPIEELMSDVKIGYSLIEGASSRTYELLAGEINKLVIYGDEGELGDITFYVGVEEWVTMEFSEERGLYISTRDSIFMDIAEQSVFSFALNGSSESHSDTVTSYVNNVSYTSDRFGNSESALSLSGDYSRFGVVDDTHVMENGEFSFSFWVKSYGSQIGAALFQCENNNSGCNLTVSYDETIGLDLEIYPYEDSPEVTRISTNNKSLSDGLWHMISLVKTAYSVRLYIDGERTEEDTDQAVAFSYPDFCLFGGTDIYDYFYFKGAIDDFLYFPRALSMEDVEKLYRESKGIF